MTQINTKANMVFALRRDSHFEVSTPNPISLIGLSPADLIS
jgi:hypothetical protein